MTSPTDFQEAHEKLGAMCGHGALAAALEKPVIDIMPHFSQGGWVNVPIMKAAIEKSGHAWTRCEKPAQGQTAVILIQWLGPWTEPERPPAAACRYRHWVASRAGLVWDVNTEQWQTQDEWKKIIPDLLPDRSTGYSVWGSLIIQPERGRPVWTIEVQKNGSWSPQDKAPNLEEAQLLASSLCHHLPEDCVRILGPHGRIC